MERERVLSNGIRLPDQWPPAEACDLEGPPPYLASPPEVIPIDLGRQLFVDDFLIESTNLQRTFHASEQYPGNPVLKPDRPWEKGGLAPRAAPFSDGVWYDPADGLFKMWYIAGTYPRETCYAFSEDGLDWTKPELDVVPGTNIVLPTDGDRRDSNTVWLDLAEEDPRKRYKMWRVMHYGEGMVNSKLSLFLSADGIHWQKAATSKRRLKGERTTVFHNPFRQTWVYSLRNNGGGRHRDYQEDPDPVRGTWEVEEHAQPWVYADGLDRRPDGGACQLYTLDCVAYESLILGLFSIFRGVPEDSRPKWTDVCLGFSRDGFHWTRPDRRPFAGLSDTPGEWNFGYVQSAGGCCLVVGDRLRFYLSGVADRPPGGQVGTGYTGLVTLRRDGFASMDAGELEGTLTTRPVRFTGGHLFVNASCSCGQLQVEVLDAQGSAIPPFTRANCLPISADSTRHSIKWQDADDLSSLCGKSVRFRFHLTRGSLYAFWVSPAPDGASHGYVAAGGPGLTAPTDTTGCSRP